MSSLLLSLLYRKLLIRATANGEFAHIEQNSVDWLREMRETALTSEQCTVYNKE